MVSVLRYLYSKQREERPDSTADVFVCFLTSLVFFNALGSTHLATSSAITQKEAGEKRTVISVKANKIKPNLVVQPYGQTPDSTEGRGRGQKCLRCARVRFSESVRLSCNTHKCNT